jgi:hypothetical protein
MPTNHGLETAIDDGEQAIEVTARIKAVEQSTVTEHDQEASAKKLVMR